MSNDSAKPESAKHHDEKPLASGAEAAPLTARAEIDAFLSRARMRPPPAATPGRGRLLFALDATMSRQPTWDTACRLQAEMFGEAAAIGGIDVQLLYFRGFGECRASPWVSQPQRLAALMGQIDCRGGHTQLRKVLAHARRETERTKIQALVYIGDAMEENLDQLASTAGELGLMGVPALMFQEGRDAVAERAFREIARLTRGAYCRFDAGAAGVLGELLRAAAVYAAGGKQALRALSQGRHAGAQMLLEQLG